MDSQTIHPSPTETNSYTLLHNPTYHIKQKTRKKAMEKLQGLILKLAETHPNASLTPAAKTHVQNRLKQLFSQYKTPDHPPYSAVTNFLHLVYVYACVCSLLFCFVCVCFHMKQVRFICPKSFQCQVFWFCMCCQKKVAVLTYFPVSVIVNVYVDGFFYVLCMATSCMS